MWECLLVLSLSAIGNARYSIRIVWVIWKHQELMVEHCFPPSIIPPSIIDQPISHLTQSETIICHLSQSKTIISQQTDHFILIVKSFPSPWFTDNRFSFAN